MRPILLALLIVLLPVRGWIGDAMAAGMAAMQVAQASAHDHAAHGPDAVVHAHAAQPAGPTAQAAAPQPRGLAAQAAADCAGHASAVGPVSHGGEPCDTCGACQVCHTVALAAVEPTLTWAPHGPAPVLAAVPRFTSADRAPGLKPPIS